MKLEHLSLILGLTKSELKKRLELGLVDLEMLNRQISENSHETKLEALCDSWHDQKSTEMQIDKFKRELNLN